MNTLRYLILWLAIVALAAITNADTLQQKVDALGAAPNVLEAWIETAPVSFGRAGTLYAGKVAWVEVSGQTVQQRGIEVIVKHLGEVGQEAAYWVGSLPAPLQVTPDAYITGRTSAAANAPKRPFTKAEVESFCNTQWRGVLINGVAVNASARDVIEFTVDNVNPNTVRVSGLFHDVAANNRIRLTYLISLVDANGAATGANVKFEKVVE